MEAFVKNKIDTLSDVFCAWMRGIPENDDEIKYFLSKHEDLAKLLNHRDIEHIVHFHAYFPNETIKAVYSLLPQYVKLSSGKQHQIFEHEFEELNKNASKIINSRVVNIDISVAYNIYMHKYQEKHLLMKRKYEEQCYKDKKNAILEARRHAYKRRRQNMTEEEKEAKRKTRREYVRKWRAEHPAERKIAAEKQKKHRQNRSEFQIINDRINSRKANRKYRNNHRGEINQKQKERRLLLKEQNPELLKEMYKKINSSPKRAEICRNYYQKHKKEINRKAKENPNTQIYKQRYAIKKRWKEKTGPVIMNLLQALALHKQGDR